MPFPETVMDLNHRITADSAILAGKPVIRGTRLSVEFVLQLIEDGWTLREVVDEYPGITVEDVRACLAFSRQMVSEQRVFPILGP